MKKILSLIALAMTIGTPSCSDDDHNSSDGPVTIPVIGSWYEEAENEEMRFSENGTFYDRYANYFRCEETEGRWEYDSKNSKLTYTYPFMGQTQFADWTVKNLKELSFTISSTKVADHHLEKIVESYTLEVGKTANIEFSKTHPDYTVISYTSNNERIASVTSDGVIKAKGEKGVTYIKVNTTSSNVWVKVTVGDNCAEMWHDYVGLMGLDYRNMRQVLSRLGEPQSGSDGYSFRFIHEQHNVINYADIFLRPDNGTVVEAQLWLKKSVSEAEILSYMTSRYYKLAEDKDYVFYSSAEDENTSKAIIVYNKSDKCVIFFETKYFKEQTGQEEMLGNYYEGLGMTRNQILAQYGAPYSEDEDILFYYVGTDYINLAAFYMDTNTGKCKRSLVTINENVPPSTIIDYLNSQYTVFPNGTYEDGSQYAWINGTSVAESTLGIIYFPADKMVIYQPLGSSAHTKSKTLAVKVIENDSDLIKQIKTKSSTFLNDIMKTKKKTTMYKSQQLKKVLENHNK